MKLDFCVESWDVLYFQILFSEHILEVDVMFDLVNFILGVTLRLGLSDAEF